MDGIRLGERIKEKHQTPVILLTVAGAGNYKNQEQLFSSILLKPIRQIELYNHICRAIHPEENPAHVEVSDTGVLSSQFAEQFPMNILVAEDNLINQKLIGHILNRLGFSAVMKENGKQAVDELIENDYDLVLMDVQMPEMDGLEATRIIRQSNIRQPAIIALTANAMQGDQEECLRSGMDDYLSKPLKLEELVLMLEKWYRP